MVDIDFGELRAPNGERKRENSTEVAKRRREEGGLTDLGRFRDVAAKWKPAFDAVEVRPYERVVINPSGQPDNKAFVVLNSRDEPWVKWNSMESAEPGYSPNMLALGYANKDMGVDNRFRLRIPSFDANGVFAGVTEMTMGVQDAKALESALTYYYGLNRSEADVLFKF